MQALHDYSFNIFRSTLLQLIEIWLCLAWQILHAGFTLDIISPFLVGEVLDIFKAAVIIHRYEWEVLQVLQPRGTPYVTACALSSEVIGTASEAFVNLLYSNLLLFLNKVICPHFSSNCAPERLLFSVCVNHCGQVHCDLSAAREPKQVCQ